MALVSRLLAAACVLALPLLASTFTFAQEATPETTTTEKPAIPTPPKPKPKPVAPAASPIKKPAVAVKKPAPVRVPMKAKAVGSWIVTCSADPKISTGCSAALQMIDPKRKLKLLTLTLGRNAKGALLLEAVTPTGVLIGPGVIMQADKVKLRSPYVSCADAGCLSRYAITESMMQAMKKNAPMRFSVMTLAGTTINIEAKPKGTAEVLALVGQ
jgi:invasion protein IalB